MLTRRSSSTRTKIRNDRHSITFLWITIPSGITSGFILAKYSPWLDFNYMIAAAGIIMFISGGIVRWPAILQLKHSFTVDVAIDQEHKLTTTGIYSRIRHPSYLGILLIMGGLSMAMNSWLSFVVVTLPVFLTLRYRIFVEEQILETEFGEEWRFYKARTKMLVPFIF